MAPSDPSADFLTLRHSISSLRSLLSSFQIALQSSIQEHPPFPQQPDPLSLFADAAKLLKAQTTKLSLLIINKPFSPKEVNFILNTLSKSVLPSLMSGWELCPAEKYTKALHEHVKSSLRVLWKELLSLLSTIPDNERGLQGQNENATLASTGVLWEQCDALIDLGENGLVVFVDKKVKAYGELFEDAIIELDDWDPDEDDEDEDEGANNRGKNDVINTPTTSDEERLGEGIAGMALSPLVLLKTCVMKHLRLIKLLYPALRKRRIATFPDATMSVENEGNARRIQILDTLVELTQHFTEHADELAGFLYSGATVDVDDRLGELITESLNTVDFAKLDWYGKEDEFTAWAQKWRSRLGELKSIP